MKLLLVDNDKQALKKTAAFLKTEGFEVETASNLETAIIDVNIHDYSCIIAEQKPEGGTVLELINELKAMKSETGMIVTSSDAVFSDKISVLEAGADDFIIKPYEPKELKARINSLIRRRQFHGQNELEYGCLRIIFDNRKVYVNDKEAAFTKKEYDLLVYLVTHSGKLLTHEMIAEHIWGDYVGITADNFELIYTHIKNIRKKLSRGGCRDLIQNVYGIGYRVTR